MKMSIRSSSHTIDSKTPYQNTLGALHHQPALGRTTHLTGVWMRRYDHLKKTSLLSTGTIGRRKTMIASRTYNQMSLGTLVNKMSLLVADHDLTTPYRWIQIIKGYASVLFQYFQYFQYFLLIIGINHA